MRDLFDTNIELGPSPPLTSFLFNFPLFRRTTTIAFRHVRVPKFVRPCSAEKSEHFNPVLLVPCMFVLLTQPQAACCRLRPIARRTQADTVSLWMFNRSALQRHARTLCIQLLFKPWLCRANAHFWYRVTPVMYLSCCVGLPPSPVVPSVPHITRRRSM